MLESLRPTISILRTFCPVIFKGFRAGALVDASMRRLVGFMEHDSLRILQVKHVSFRGRVFRDHQVIQKLPQLAMIRHVAAKN